MADKYQSLVEVRGRFVSGDDYAACHEDRRSWATIVTPHGGYIEPGTSAIARAVAGVEYNYFDFQGLLRGDRSYDLHITSTRFRDPVLDKLLANSKVAVTIHSMGTSNMEVIWLGGLNLQLKAIVLEQLKQQGFSVEPDPPLYRGENPRNVVNLPSDRGVQLELSSELIASLFSGPVPALPSDRTQTTGRFTALVSALQTALAQYGRMSQP